MVPIHTYTCIDCGLIVESSYQKHLEIHSKGILYALTCIVLGLVTGVCTRTRFAFFQWYIPHCCTPHDGEMRYAYLFIFATLSLHDDTTATAHMTNNRMGADGRMCTGQVCA
jgi:hypothetical protein